MARLPKIAKIGPHKYRIVLKEPKQMDKPSSNFLNSLRRIGRHYFHFGEICFDGLEISINKNQERSMMAETLLHECLHGIIGEMGLRHVVPIKKEEDLVQGLAYNLLIFMRENPNIVKYLSEKVDHEKKNK